MYLDSSSGIGSIVRGNLRFGRYPGQLTKFLLFNHVPLLLLPNSRVSGLSRLSRHKREVVGEELSGHSVHEAWKVWVANISESLPMAVSTVRLVLIRRATAPGS